MMKKRKENTVLDTAEVYLIQKMAILGVFKNSEISRGILVTQKHGSTF